MLKINIHEYSKGLCAFSFTKLMTKELHLNHNLHDKNTTFSQLHSCFVVKNILIKSLPTHCMLSHLLPLAFLNITPT